MPAPSLPLQPRGPPPLIQFEVAEKVPPKVSTTEIDCGVSTALFVLTAISQPLKVGMLIVVTFTTMVPPGAGIFWV